MLEETLSSLEEGFSVSEDPLDTELSSWDEDDESLEPKRPVQDVKATSKAGTRANRRECFILIPRVEPTGLNHTPKAFSFRLSDVHRPKS